MKAVIIIFLVFNLNCTYSQEEIINKTEIFNFGSIKFNECYDYSLNNKMIDDYETIYDKYKKEDLVIFPIPILSLHNNSSINKMNFIESINFNEFESQLIFIVNDKYIVSSFGTGSCFEPFYILKNLRYSVIGAERLLYSTYDFNSENFYFFLEEFKGVFEISNNRIYYIRAFLNYENLKDEYLDMDLKYVKDLGIIDFIKVDMNTLIEKMTINSIKDFEKKNKTKCQQKFFKKISKKKSSKTDNKIKFI